MSNLERAEYTQCSFGVGGESFGNPTTYLHIHNHNDVMHHPGVNSKSSFLLCES